MQKTSSIKEHIFQNDAIQSTAEDTVVKRRYCAPSVETVRIDREISLQLASDPPTFESMNGKTSDTPYYT